MPPVLASVEYSYICAALVGFTWSTCMLVAVMDRLVLLGLVCVAYVGNICLALCVGGC